MTRREAEGLLAGGNLNVVVRVGDTVRRPAGEWTPAVHALLNYLEAAGFSGAPRARGVDEEGREIITYVPGTAGRNPLPPALWSDESLALVARLVRGYHDATIGFIPPHEARWRVMSGAPAPAGDSVICHNDLAPYNTIYAGAAPMAFIDWDLAAPGPRSWDIAHALWRYVPVAADAAGAAAPPSPTDQARRARVFCDAYGSDRLSARDRFGLIEITALRMRALHDTVEQWAAAGVPGFAAMAGTAHSLGPLRDAEHLAANRAIFEKALA